MELKTLNITLTDDEDKIVESLKKKWKVNKPDVIRRLINETKEVVR